jgi:hypothetical protein
MRSVTDELLLGNGCESRSEQPEFDISLLAIEPLARLSAGN